MTLYKIENEVGLHSPVLVVCLEGWIDAGFGAQGALAALEKQIETKVIATFDTEELINYRSRRPTLNVKDGLNDGIQWPVIELRHGKDPLGNDVLVLAGAEPDLRWKNFADEVATLAKSLEVHLAVGLGAFPSPAPHTRPVRLATTATSEILAEEIGHLDGSLAVPSGVEGVLEKSFERLGIPAVGLWARVPHYVSAMHYPGASASLLDGLVKLSGISLDTTELHAAASGTRERVDDLISQSREHTDMVSQLERQVDMEGAFPQQFDHIPSGEEIAAELERYLQDHEADKGPSNNDPDGGD